ncbi:MAG: MogA/MoaB family molybdenum cofactor biosynthesis protein [Lachnospiraceae bacterium]|nr:MogA/MoaB family molybdenum cofactor biosynthesis protein [Lachnospiraceae bacterium]
MYSAVVITSSDRAYEGIYEDKSGPLLKEMLERAGYSVRESLILPDEEEMIYDKLILVTGELKPDVIFTTGGTGFSERDRVPEATIRACDRMAPGIAEAIRAYSMQYTKKAMLSRAVSGIKDRTIIINLPGSPKAVKECLELVIPVLSHGIDILRGEGEK